MLKLFREADRVTTEIDPTLIGIVRLPHVFDSFLSTRVWFTNLLGRDVIPGAQALVLASGDLVPLAP